MSGTKLLEKKRSELFHRWNKVQGKGLNVVFCSTLASAYETASASFKQRWYLSTQTVGEESVSTNMWHDQSALSIRKGLFDPYSGVLGNDPKTNLIS